MGSKERLGKELHDGHNYVSARRMHGKPVWIAMYPMTPPQVYNSAYLLLHEQPLLLEERLELSRREMLLDQMLHVL